MNFRVFMLVPELQPFVKLKRCDGKSVAKVFYCGVSKKPFPQYAEDEHQGIRGIRNPLIFWRDKSTRHCEHTVKTIDALIIQHNCGSIGKES